MRKLFGLLMISTLIGLLTSCAQDNLNAPCPNFGSHCSKVPVNRWDYH